MKINKNHISALILMIGISFFGAKVGRIGVPLISVLLYILLNITAIKFSEGARIYSVYYLIIIFSTLLSAKIELSVIDLFSATLYLILAYTIFSGDYLKKFFLKNFMYVFVVRSIFELRNSFVHSNEWIGKFKDFMRFSVSSLGGDPNNLSLIALVAILGGIYYGGKKIRYIPILIILIHFMMLFSRGSIIAFLVGSIIFSLKNNKKNLLKILIGLIGSVIIFNILNNLDIINFDVSVYFSGKDTSSQSRLRFWSETLKTLNFKQVLIGNGPRTYSDYFVHWAHNSFINRIFEVGVGGLLIYIYMNFFNFFTSKKNRFINFLLLILIIGSIFVDFYSNLLFMIIIFSASKKEPINCHVS